MQGFRGFIGFQGLRGKVYEGFTVTGGSGMLILILKASNVPDTRRASTKP